MRVERESAYADELLHSALLDPLSQADRNLTTELVMGVLRWRSLLDAAISAFISMPLTKLDLEVLIALRLGAYQIGFLDRIPRHAAVDESVELVKQARKRSAAGMVNAVLRKLEPGGFTTPDTDLALKYAHPPWLVEKWVGQFGREQAELICRFDQQPPVTALRGHGGETRRRLEAEGIHCRPGALMKNALLVESGDVTHTRLFREGQVRIQDEGSQLVAALVGPGKRILDCCAAPGGKTSALADASPEARIVAAEIHPHRVELLRRMVPPKNVEVIAADATRLPFGAEFDRVLADVPCSGTGTLARNPEIKWKLKPDDLIELQKRQVAILEAAVRYLAPGGRLVYSTCSLETEENEQVVEKVLREHPELKIVSVADELQKLREAGALVWEDMNNLTQGSYLRTVPGIHPCDGFFAAVVEKVAAMADQ